MSTYFDAPLLLQDDKNPGNLGSAAAPLLSVVAKSFTNSALSGTPTVAAGASASAASLVAGSTDNRGQISATGLATGAAGVLCTITLAGSEIPEHVSLQAMNAATAACELYWSFASGVISLSSANAPAASAAIAISYRVDV